MNVVNEFEALPWHDAVLLDLEVDRAHPGERDYVKVAVRWPDGKTNSLCFEDCYLLLARMNFGVEAEESILSAQCSMGSDELMLLREKWANLGVNLDALRCFTINTNSTASTLEIFAAAYYIE